MKIYGMSVGNLMKNLAWLLPLVGLLATTAVIFRIVQTYDILTALAILFLASTLLEDK